MERKSDTARHTGTRVSDAPASLDSTSHVPQSALPHPRPETVVAAATTAGKRRPAPLSYEEVAQAAQVIDAAGEKVTIARIRQQVGGAAETVTAFLGRWRQTRRNARFNGDGSDGLPEALRVALLGAFAEQRDAAQSDMRERLQEQHEAASELDAELRRARASIEEHESVIESLRHDLERAQQAVAASEQAAARGNEKLVGQVETLSQQVDDLRREHVENRELLVQMRCQAETETGRAQTLSTENKRLQAELGQANQRAEDARQKTAAAEQAAAVANARLEGQAELLAIAKAQVKQADMRATEHLERARTAESLEDKLRHKLDVAHHAHDPSQAPAQASAKASPTPFPAGTIKQTSGSKPKDAKP